MPEWWEKEIQKLGTVSAPPSTRSRLDEGPNGDGMPPAPRRGQRIVASVVAFAVFGAAAALVAGAFRHSEPTNVTVSSDDLSAVLHLTATDDGPIATLSYGDRTVQPQTGSYCWNGTTKCVDTSLSPFAAEDFVKVHPDTPIVIARDDSLDEASVWIEHGDDPNDVALGLVDAITTIQGPPGKYVLAVAATWPLGRVQLYFPIEIVNALAPSSTPDPAVLTASLKAPGDGTVPELVLSFEGASSTFDAQDGHWPGVTLSPIPIQTLDATIDPGTTLMIAGDATRVEGAVEIADEHQTLTGQSTSLDLSSGSATLPDEPGFYRLTIAGTWPTGEAGFSVAITIGTPTSDWPPAPPIVPVPDVVGLSQHEAVARLTDAGFVSVSVAVPASQTGGVVTSQDPAPGTQIATTTTVKLTISMNG